jgi:hypothetical protein
MSRCATLPPVPAFKATLKGAPLVQRTASVVLADALP